MATVPLSIFEYIRITLLGKVLNLACIPCIISIILMPNIPFRHIKYETFEAKNFEEFAAQRFLS